MSARPNSSACRLLFLAVLAHATAQERARDAPFSCEPVVAGSVVFRGFALENHEPGPKELVRFQVEEAFFGVRPGTKELEVTLELEEGLGRGEERIVGSLPNENGENWSVEKFDQELDKEYLKYLRGLRSGNAPARILGWTDYEGVPLPGTVVRAVGSGHEYETKSSPQGIFELSGVAPGKYRVSVSGRAEYETKGLPFEDVEVVPAGCTVLSFPFSFKGAIRGTVRDLRGRPQEGLRVDLVELEGEEEAYDRSKDTDSEGNYSFTGVDPGRYRVGISLAQLSPRQPYPRLYAPGVAEVARASIVQLSEDQPHADADLWLPDPKLRPFEIEVCWPDGSPAKGAAIALVYGSWHEPADLHVDDHGAISLRGYELLDYRIPTAKTSATVSVATEHRALRNINIPYRLPHSPRSKTAHAFGEKKHGQNWLKSELGARSGCLASPDWRLGNQRTASGPTAQ